MARKLIFPLISLATVICVVLPEPRAVAGEPSASMVLFEEHFNTDVVGTGEWVRSDTSVAVDMANSWLRIGSNGAVNDSARRYGPFQLPLTIEWRERTFTGDPGVGPYFSLPKLEFWWESFNITITYSQKPGDGWLFGSWTNIHTLGPTSWDQWRTVKAIIRGDGGELFAKQDTDPDFIHIATATWAIPSVIGRIRLSQHSDDVSDFDYVRISREVCFDRGADLNCDKVEDVFDVIYLIDYVFSGGPPRVPCPQE